MKPLFSFGIIADCQFDDRDNATAISSDARHIHDNRFRQSKEKLEEAIEFFNDKDLEFIVHLGDFVDSAPENNAPILNEVTAKSAAPIWHVLGNHEFHKTTLSESKIINLYRMENTYYSKSLKSHRFIVLDTNELGTVKYSQGTPEWDKGNEYLQHFKDIQAINAYPWNGGVGAKQIEWFKAQIEDAHRADEKVIVFAHHPVFPRNGSNALNDEEILAAIDSSKGITAFINGHNHFGNTGIRKSIPYITTHAIVQGATNAYAIANVYENAFELISYGHAQDVWIETS